LPNASTLLIFSFYQKNHKKLDKIESIKALRKNTYIHTYNDDDDDDERNVSKILREKYHLFIYFEKFLKKFTDRLFVVVVVVFVS
jgi:hypothetical protein